MYGMSKRQYKKHYKYAVDHISKKIHLAFPSEKERKKWVSEVTNLRMKDTLKAPEVKD